MQSKIDSVYRKHDGSRICQGDILRDFEYVEWTSVVTEKETDKGKKIQIKKIILPYIVVLTQDCDLESDFKNHVDSSKNQDKFLHSVLVCPAYHAEKFRMGDHLKMLELKMESINSKRWDNLTNNQIPRYHFLQSYSSLQIPELVLDFKHYYAVPRDTLYKEAKNHYLGSINELFRESLSQRFAYYLSRIGLPLARSEESEMIVPEKLGEEEE